MRWTRDFLRGYIWAQDEYLAGNPTECIESYLFPGFGHESTSNREFNDGALFQIRLKEKLDAVSSLPDSI